MTHRHIVGFVMSCSLLRIVIHCNFPVHMKMLEHEDGRSNLQTSSDGRFNSKAKKQINVIIIFAFNQNSMFTLNINIKHQTGQFLLWRTPL